MSLINIVEHDTDETLDDLLLQKTRHKLTLIFTTRKQLENNFVLRRRLFDRYNVPEYIWSDVCKRLQGYFGSEDFFSEDETTVISHVTWFHFEIKFPFKGMKDGKIQNTYVWHKMGIATSWTETDHHTIIFFDVAASVRAQLEVKCESVRDSPALGNPYWAHKFLVEPIIACYDKAVWNLRDQVRELEEHRRSRGKAVDAVNNLEFNDLHEILRHALHATETIGVAIQTLGNIRNRQRTFDNERSLAEKEAAKEIPKKVAATKHNGRKIAGDLEFQLSILESLEARAKANEARIRSEITLAFSSVAQRDSQVQAEIGHAAQADSSAMKAIAIVTMIFLPSTSVSAILSTSFFDFKPQEDHTVSKQFWIYWVVSVPLTILVVLFWYAWDRRQPENRALFSGGRPSTAANQTTGLV